MKQPARVAARLGAFRLSAGRHETPGSEEGRGGAAGTTAAETPGSALGHVACVYLDTSSPTELDYLSSLVLKAQNGERRFLRSAPDFWVGDTAIHVSLIKDRKDPQAILVGIWARLGPAHLTTAFTAWTRVPRNDARAFCLMFDKTRDFIFTVGCQGKLALDKLYLVKYYFEGNFRPRF